MYRDSSDIQTVLRLKVTNQRLRQSVDSVFLCLDVNVEAQLAGRFRR